MELANNIHTACFTMLRTIIIRVCVNSIVMARFISISGYMKRFSSFLDKTFRLFTQVGILLVFYFCLFFNQVIASNDQPVDQHNEEIIIEEHNAKTDSLLPVNQMRIRLQDPDYDVRYDRGTVHPWHDLKSIYLRRTIPVTHLAFIRELNLI